MQIAEKIKWKFRNSPVLNRKALRKMLLANPNKYEGESNRQSVVFFTAWKCGTTIADQIFRQLLPDKALQAVDYQSYIEYNLWIIRMKN